jgi:uncharacterized membrane protein/uncharacterized integral membrane protein
MSSGTKRYLFIDEFRGWAVLAMIETHVLNSFLQVGLRGALWFRVLDFVNGLVAPAFLFIAGFSFGMVALNRWSEFLGWGPVFWKQLGRVLQIGLIGYCLRIPRFSLHHLLASVHWNQVHVFWKVDILHCIAFSLLAMLLLIKMIRRPAFYFPALAVLGLTISLLTPICARTHIGSVLPVPLAMYVNQLNGSLFPVFPWTGFVFFGGTAAWMWRIAQENGTEWSFFKSISVAGSGIVVMAGVFRLTLFGPLAINFLRRYSPGFFFLRLGLLLLFLSGLWLWEKRRNPVPSMVTIAGRESLLVYVGHILVIFGMFFGPYGKSLVYMIGKSRTPLEVALMTIILVGAMLALAQGWNQMKKDRRQMSRILQFVFLGIVLAWLLIH